jgi:predicted  nucleic acid-binding Zn-ribbon protein
MDKTPMCYEDILSAKEKIEKLLSEQREAFLAVKHWYEEFESKVKQLDSLVAPVMERINRAAEEDFTPPEELVN